jgi:hypothetical protein
MQHTGCPGHAAQLCNVLEQRQLLESQRLPPRVKKQVSIAWSLPREVSAFPSLTLHYAALIESRPVT